VSTTWHVVATSFNCHSLSLSFRRLAQQRCLKTAARSFCVRIRTFVLVQVKLVPGPATPPRPPRPSRPRGSSNSSNSMGCGEYAGKWSRNSCLTLLNATTLALFLILLRRLITIRKSMFSPLDSLVFQYSVWAINHHVEHLASTRLVLDYFCVLFICDVFPNSYAKRLIPSAITTCSLRWISPRCSSTLLNQANYR
jgi:hypothetical protein